MNEHTKKAREHLLNALVAVRNARGGVTAIHERAALQTVLESLQDAHEVLIGFDD